MLFDHRIEKAVIAAILHRNGEFDKARALLGAGEAFELSSHRTIWRKTAQMIAAGGVVDVVLLAQALQADGALSAVGGLAYLSDLLSVVLRTESVEPYARRMLELWQLRQLAGIGEELASETGATSAVELIEQTRTRIESILCDSAVDDTAIASFAADVLNDWQEERSLGRRTGLSYGLAGLDLRTGGMTPGENTTIGGSPGAGKSVLATQAILANCPGGQAVFYVSLEMTRAQVLRRIWGNLSGIGPRKLRRAYESSPSEAEAVRRAAMVTADWPLHIYDKSSVRLEQLSGMLRLGIRRHKVRLFILDFAQILSVGGKDARERVSRASDELTAIAKGEGVHLMLLSQMARKSHSEWDRPPRMSDLRESGALEQNAHTVILIHRPWDEANGRICETPAGPDRPGCELIIAKQREGGTSAFPVRFNPHKLVFEDIDTYRGASHV